MFTTLGATFLTTGATLVAALSSRLIGVSWMVSLGAGFALAGAGAAPARGAAWRAIRIKRLPSAANCLVRNDCAILFMSFSCSTILHSGTDVTFPYATPALTRRAAVCSNVTPRAAFVKSVAWRDSCIAGTEHERPGRLGACSRPYFISSRESAGRYAPFSWRRHQAPVLPRVAKSVKW